MRGTLALLLLALTVRCQVEADFSDAIETQTLNADEYQGEIVRIDRLVFGEEALGADGTAALQGELDGLAKRVKAAGDSKFLRVESLELQLLAKKAGRLSPKRNGAPLQNDWMRIRNNLFDDRAWFARSAADLDYAAAATREEALPLPPPSFGVSADAPRSMLTGQWQVRSMRANGEPSSDRELLHSLWSFDEPRLTILDRDGNSAVFEYLRDGDLLRVSGAEGSGCILYAIDGEGLLLAFHDGFARKPESFEADPSMKDPLHIVLRLVPVR